MHETIDGLWRGCDWRKPHMTLAQTEWEMIQKRLRGNVTNGQNVGEEWERLRCINKGKIKHWARLKKKIYWQGMNIDA